MSKKIRNSARGEDCTLRIPGVCNGNPETTVWAHLPHWSKGMGKKAVDISGCYACSSCHDFIDDRNNQGLNEELESTMRIANIDSLLILVDKEIIVIK